MRTTLDLDAAVLSAARAKANAEHISLGRAVSELALAGLRGRETSIVRGASGFPVLRGVAGHRVTDELVAAHRDDDPRVDAA
jgi:4'-phosphopantetheinyl transferase EntD